MRVQRSGSASSSRRASASARQSPTPPCVRLRVKHVCKPARIRNNQRFAAPMASIASSQKVRREKAGSRQCIDASWLAHLHGGSARGSQRCVSTTISPRVLGQPADRPVSRDDQSCLGNTRHKPARKPPATNRSPLRRPHWQERESSGASLRPAERDKTLPRPHRAAERKAFPFSCSGSPMLFNAAGVDRSTADALRCCRPGTDLSAQPLHFPEVLASCLHRHRVPLASGKSVDRARPEALRP